MRVFRGVTIVPLGVFTTLAELYWMFTHPGQGGLV